MGTEKALKPHEQRVVEEYKELRDRTSKLEEFIRNNEIYHTLDINEQEDMRGQYLSMETTMIFLRNRIERFRNN